MISKEKIVSSWKSFSESPRFDQIKKYARRIIVLVIVGLILYQLFEIGWREVFTSLPTVPLFYILFGVLYLSLPTVEVFIYRQVWRLKRRDLFRAFLTKRVYNEEVMGYSGEFYLFMWARKHLDRREVEILKNIRDNNILSSVTSNLVAFSLIGLLIFTGVIDVEDIFGNVSAVYMIAGLVILIAFIALFIQFRRYLFSLSLKKAVIVFSLYMTRFITHHSLMIVQWAVVIENTPLSVWFTFLAIVIVVNRIPFLPSRDLIFMWAGIELSRMLNMATASVAGMLLVSSALKKTTNLILYLLITYYFNDPGMDRVEEANEEDDPINNKEPVSDPH